MIETSTIYLWNTSIKLFKIYKVLRNYLNRDFEMDSIILLKLIETNYMDIEDSLFKISYLHSGYSSLLFEYLKAQNDG